MMILNVLGLTYLIGLLWNGYRSCMNISALMRERDEQYHPLAMTLSVAVASVLWPITPLILAYLQKGDK